MRHYVNVDRRSYIACQSAARVSPGPISGYSPFVSTFLLLDAKYLEQFPIFCKHYPVFLS